MVQSSDVNVDNLLRVVHSSSDSKMNTHSHCPKRAVESEVLLNLNRFIFTFKVHDY